jgi:glutamine synthetase
MSAALIVTQVQRLQADFALRPVTASEIEFYLHGSDACASMPAFWNEVRAACQKQNIGIFKIEKEKGREQHEVALTVADPVKTASDTVALKSIVTEIAARHKLRADFSAKPFAGEPGSGLHIHVHLVDERGKNVFFKDDAKISDALQFSIGGLLAWLPGCMPVFAPRAESYARFAPGGNAPTTISWGANNRTVAVRLPDAAHDNKRIEHRASGSDADPMLVMAVVLAAMHYGLKNKIQPSAQIYGDASLSQYDLPGFPVSLEEAQSRLEKSEIIAGYFSAADLLPAR